MLVADMLLSLLNICTKEELEEQDEGLIRAKESAEESAERKRVIKSKIMAVGRVSRVFALLRYASCGPLTLSFVDNLDIEKSLSAFLSSRTFPA